uniref:Uncharacterized protein n=1 Tax=Arundo donax TaxID=35708 RepID=A0A0A9GBD0_ARUDO
MHRLNSAVAASFLPLELPLCNNSTNASIAPSVLPIIILLSSIRDKLKIAAAAFSLASMLPVRNTCMIGTMAPATTISSLF